ncbi:MAG: hypothetical protein ACOH5I_26020 [Oligoflexus sp.]
MIKDTLLKEKKDLLAEIEKALKDQPKKSETGFLGAARYNELNARLDRLLYRFELEKVRLDINERNVWAKTVEKFSGGTGKEREAKVYQEQEYIEARMAFEISDSSCKELARMSKNLERAYHIYLSFAERAKA